MEVLSFEQRTAGVHRRRITEIAAVRLCSDAEAVEYQHKRAFELFHRESLLLWNLVNHLTIDSKFLLFLYVSIVIHFNR